MSPYEMASWDRLSGSDVRNSVPHMDTLIDELRAANQRLIVAGVREQELAEQSRFQSTRLNALLNSINEGVLVANPTGEIALANPIARKILGFAEGGRLTLQEDWAQIEMRTLDGQPVPPEHGPLIRALLGEAFCDYEIVVLVRVLGERLLTFTSGAVRDEGGAVVQAVLLFRDITELRKLEQQREESLSLISHDLRTPLTVIMGRAEILASLAAHDGNRAVATEIESILRSARRMRSMLDDFLEMSRLESLNPNLRQQPVDLRAVVDGVIADEISIAERSRVQVRAAPDLPILLGDGDRLGRVVANLLTNALKFSESCAPVDVWIRQVSADVVVSVTDRGVGIPSHEVQRLFERYYQTTAGHKRRGQGLGLYLSRLIVEASGGKIWVYSVPGEGSTFHFSLPIR